MPAPPIRPHSVPAQRIGGIVSRLPAAVVTGDEDTQVTGITHDSRHVQQGDIYLARAGRNTHGIAHVDAAIAAGASVVLTDVASAPRAQQAGARTVVQVDDPQAVAGPAAAWVYGDPSQHLMVIGITGTNGKTTTAYLAEAGLHGEQRRTGLIGTIETHVGDDVLPSARTTPESTDLQALFAVMRERDVSAVAMEVSSHALALGRVAGTTYAVAVFTNLSQDHLDFHRDMEDYFAAKASLFTPALSRTGVVCVDDEWGRRLAREAEVPVTTVGDAPADWTRIEEKVHPRGGRVVLRDPHGETHDLDVAIAGRFNLRNAAAAYVALVVAGVDPTAARKGLSGLRSVPGRMENVDAGQPFVALVDYAHTPEAVSTLLTEARGLTADGGRVVVVLGCGGDRDRAKRPLMGAAAATLADVAVLTSDNPRSEDPDAILAAMVDGVPRDAMPRVETVVDRRSAIDRAIDVAAPGDVVVIAGKGHEQGQEYADRTVPFDDRVVVRAALAAHGFPAGAA